MENKQSPESPKAHNKPLVKRVRSLSLTQWQKDNFGRRGGEEMYDYRGIRLMK
jgi:hypothetical protein